MKRKSAARGSMGLVVTLAGLAASVHAACGGKVVIEEELAGAGGASSSSGSKASVSVGTSVVSTSVTSTGPSTVSATAGGGPCVSCAAFLTGEAGMLCPESEKYYEAVIACVCVKDKGCVKQCANNACVNAPVTEACTECITTVCSGEFNACANDV